MRVEDIIEVFTPGLPENWRFDHYLTEVNNLGGEARILFNFSVKVDDACGQIHLTHECVSFCIRHAEMDSTLDMNAIIATSVLDEIYNKMRKRYGPTWRNRFPISRDTMLQDAEVEPDVYLDDLITDDLESVYVQPKKILLLCKH